MYTMYTCLRYVKELIKYYYYYYYYYYYCQQQAARGTVFAVRLSDNSCCTFHPSVNTYRMNIKKNHL